MSLFSVSYFGGWTHYLLLQTFSFHYQVMNLLFLFLNKLISIYSKHLISNLVNTDITHISKAIWILNNFSECKVRNIPYVASAKGMMSDVTGEMESIFSLLRYPFTCRIQIRKWYTFNEEWEWVAFKGQYSGWALIWPAMLYGFLLQIMCQAKTTSTANSLGCVYPGVSEVNETSSWSSQTLWDRCKESRNMVSVWVAKFYWKGNPLAY